MDARIMVVGGPSSIAMSWTQELTEAGATVDVVTNGPDALRHLALLAPDIVLMDVHLPGQLDGFETCRAICARSAVIVVLSTTCPGPFDEVVALAVGGDHFLAGETPGPLVVARLSALLRRARGTLRSGGATAHHDGDAGSSLGSLQGRVGQARAAELVTEGDLAIDVVAREVRVKGELTQLTRIEFDLLVTLAQNPRRVFTREQLMMGAWDEPFDGSHILDTHLSRLRRKITTVGGERVAHAVRGVGFRLRS